MADNTYPKRSRLLSANDFSNLKINSSVFKRFNLRVYYLKNNLANSRLGISVSTKVSKSVKRNRLKRIIRESFRASDFKNLNYDVLFVVMTSRTTDFNKFEQDLSKSIYDFYSYITKESKRGNDA